MFEASVRVLASDEFLALTQSIVDSVNCTPIEAANIAAFLPAFYLFVIGLCLSFFLESIANWIVRFSRWLFKVLKAQYRKRKEKGR